MGIVVNVTRSNYMVSCTGSYFYWLTNGAVDRISRNYIRKCGKIVFVASYQFPRYFEICVIRHLFDKHYLTLAFILKLVYILNCKTMLSFGNHL